MSGVNNIKNKLIDKRVRFQTLSLLFNMRKAVQEAKDEVANLGGRHDIPHDPRIPDDLRDREGSWQLTKEGYPTTGRILPNELTIGSASPTLPLYLVGWVFILPFMSLTGLAGKLLTLMYIFGLIAYFGAIPTALMTIFTLAPSMALSMLGAFRGMVENALPVSLDILLGTIPALLPAIYWLIKSKQRATLLLAMGTRYNGAIVNSPKTGHNEARFKQALNAMKDKTHFIKLGKATGAFSKVGDAFSPDKDLDFGLTTGDTSKHIIILGSTGTGKTSSGLRPIVSAIVEEEKQSIKNR